MADDLTIRVFRARLNYEDVRQYTDWQHVMINDYLGITQGTLALTDQIDQNTFQVNINTNNILELENITAGHQITLLSIKGRVGENRKLIKENNALINTNIDNINENALKINDLEQLVNRL